MKRSTKVIILSAATVIVAGGGVATIAVAQDAPPSSPGELGQARDAALAAVGEGDVVSIEQDDRDGYDVEVRLPDGSDVDVDVSPAFEVLRTESDDRDGDDDSDDVAPPGADIAAASEAALAAADGGSVTDVEWDDGGYEVEIRTTDGRELDVRLDDAFVVTGTSEEAGD